MATIPTHSNAYTNPQAAFKQSFISYSDRRTAGLASLSKSLQSIGAWIQKENASQKALVAEQSATQLQMYNKVDSLPTFGEDFNTRQEQYWDSKIDDYLDIKNRIEAGDITPREGNKELTKINRLLKNYQTIAPQVLALANEVKSRIMIEPGEEGAISGLVQTHVQKVLLDMLDGKDVGLVDRDGVLFLYEPEVGYINLNELTIAETKETNSFLKFVPKYDEFLSNAAKATFGDFDTGTFIDGMVTIRKVKRRNSATGEMQELTIRSIDETQKALAEEKIIKNKLLQPLIDNYDYMSVIWNDVMETFLKDTPYENTAWHDPGDLDTQPRANEVFSDAEKFMKDQNALALEFLTRQAIEDYVREGGLEYRPDVDDLGGRVTNVGDVSKPEKAPELERDIKNYYNAYTKRINAGDSPAQAITKLVDNITGLDKVLTGSEIVAKAPTKVVNGQTVVDTDAFVSDEEERLYRDALANPDRTYMMIKGVPIPIDASVTSKKAFKDLMSALLAGQNVSAFVDRFVDQNLKFN